MSFIVVLHGNIFANGLRSGLRLQAHLFPRLPGCILLRPTACGRVRVRPTSLAVRRRNLLVLIVFRWPFRFIIRPCCTDSY